MVIQWDFTLVKAYDEHFIHSFPDVLVGGIFKTLKEKYLGRDFIHLIRKNDSVSYSMHGLTYCHHTKWGEGFPPNHATPSSVYRECHEVGSAWIDTESHILYYKHTEQDKCMYEGIWSIFGGSNPILQTVRCNQETFSRFAMYIRENYIKIACNSATVCLIDDGRIQSTHKVIYASK